MLKEEFNNMFFLEFDKIFIDMTKNARVFLSRHENKK